MNVFINGKEETIEPGTIENLVTGKRLEPASLVVELNRKIIKQSQWSAVEIQEGDRLELLSFVGGG